MHLRAVGAAPQDSSVLYNYALFLETKRKDYASADDFYQVKRNVTKPQRFILVKTRACCTAMLSLRPHALVA